VWEGGGNGDEQGGRQRWERITGRSERKGMQKSGAEGEGGEGEGKVGEKRGAERCGARGENDK